MHKHLPAPTPVSQSVSQSVSDWKFQIGDCYRISEFETNIFGYLFVSKFLRMPHSDQHITDRVRHNQSPLAFFSLKCVGFNTEQETLKRSSVLVSFTIYLLPRFETFPKTRPCPHLFTRDGIQSKHTMSQYLNCHPFSPKLTFKTYVKQSYHVKVKYQGPPQQRWVSCWEDEKVGRPLQLTATYCMPHPFPAVLNSDSITLSGIP